MTGQPIIGGTDPSRTNVPGWTRDSITQAPGPTL
jgi:hypothetical protein